MSSKKAKSRKSKRSKKNRKSSKGSLMRMRGGLKGVVSGSGRESKLSSVITWILLAAAIALLVYRMTR